MHGEWICAKIAYSLKDFQEQLMTFKQMESFCSGLPRLWANIFPLWFFPKISVCLALNLQFSFFVFRYFMIFSSPSQKMGPEGLEVMQFSKPRGCFKEGCLSTSGKNCDRIWIAMPAWIFYAISFFPTSGKLGTPSSSCSFLI